MDHRDPHQAAGPPPPGRPAWRSFVALGDSFTEGVGDPDPVTGVERGWADRVAEALAADAVASGPGADPGEAVRYANLAVRGTLLERIVATQVPAAVAMAPDLVALCAAGNDLLRPGADPAALARTLDDAVVTLRATGADVVLFTGFDTRQTPLLRLIGRRLAAMNDEVRAIARARGAFLVDLWVMGPLADPRARAEDRLHLNADGHRRVAARTCEVLGLDVPQALGDWGVPWPAAPSTSWSRRRAGDLRWAREHLAPWVQRRVEGRSTGDGRPPKRPEPIPVRP